ATTGTWSSRRRVVAAICSRFGAALRQNQNGRPASASCPILTSDCLSRIAHAYIHLSELAWRSLSENVSEYEFLAVLGPGHVTSAKPARNCAKASQPSSPVSLGIVCY